MSNEHVVTKATNTYKVNRPPDSEDVIGAIAVINAWLDHQYKTSTGKQTTARQIRIAPDETGEEKTVGEYWEPVELAALMMHDPKSVETEPTPDTQEGDNEM